MQYHKGFTQVSINFGWVISFAFIKRKTLLYKIILLKLNDSFLQGKTPTDLV